MSSVLIARLRIALMLHLAGLKPENDMPIAGFVPDNSRYE